MVSKRKFQSDVKVDNTEELTTSPNSRGGRTTGLAPWGPGAGGRLQNDSGPGKEELQPRPPGALLSSLLSLTSRISFPAYSQVLPPGF